MDAVQSRYGWTDEVVLSLPYARLMQIFDTISEVKKEEGRDKWQRSAFTAYLVGAQLGAYEGQDTTFSDFLSILGLSDNPEENINHNNTKEEAIDIANRVIAQFHA